MKIYFVYRSPYESISRYLKIFEADSILGLFQANWDTLSTDKDDLIEFFGLYVYGFPISDVVEGHKTKIPAPQSIEDLKIKLKKYVYINEIRGNEHCIEVSTDDDEVALSWYVFDEFFAKENLDKITFWLTKELPTSFGANGILLGDNRLYGEVLPKGTQKGCLYLGLVSDIDTSQYYFFEGLVKIENIRLPNFLDYLREQTITYESKKRNVDKSVIYLKILQYLAKHLPNSDLHSIIKNFCKLSLPELSEDLDDLTVNKITKDLTKDDNWSLTRFQPLNEYGEMMLKMRGECFKPFISVSEHLCEWGEIFEADVYNYFVIFDDLWVEENEDIAKNLSQFFKGEWL